VQTVLKIVSPVASAASVLSSDFPQPAKTTNAETVNKAFTFFIKTNFSFPSFGRGTLLGCDFYPRCHVHWVGLFLNFTMPLRSESPQASNCFRHTSSRWPLLRHPALLIWHSSA